MRIEHDVKPVTYMKTRAAELLRSVEESRRPVIITQSGEPKGVLMDFASYQELRQATLLLRLLAQGEAEVRQGRSVPEERVQASLRARFGEQMQIDGARCGRTARRLESIVAYLADRSPQAALATLDRLEARAKSLLTLAGRARRAGAAPPARPAVWRGGRSALPHCLRDPRVPGRGPRRARRQAEPRGRPPGSPDQDRGAGALALCPYAASFCLVIARRRLLAQLEGQSLFPPEDADRVGATDRGDRDGIEHGVRPVTYMKTKAAELLSSLRDLVLKRLDADGKPDEGSALVPS